MNGEVHVWFVRTASVSDAALAAAQELLSADEYERQQRLHREPLLRDFAIKRALVRRTLSRYADVDPQAWTFTTVDNGRPAIASPDAGDLDFSVADTKGLVAVLVTRGIRAAIDVEYLEPRVNAERMARRFFSPEEQAAFFANDPSLRRFFALWTAKEAYVKALGAGFAEPFRGFTISLDPLSVGDGWHLEQVDFGQDYAATVAMRGERRTIIVREAVRTTTA